MVAEELTKLELDEVGIAEHLMSWLDWLRAILKLVGRELLLLLGLQINLSVRSGLVQLLQDLKYLLGGLIVVLHYLVNINLLTLSCWYILRRSF